MRLHSVDFVIFLPLKNRKANICTDRVYCLTPVRFRTTWPKIADNIVRQFISGLQLIHAFSFVLGVHRVTLGEGEVKTLTNKQMLRIIQPLEEVQCHKLCLLLHWKFKKRINIQYTYLPTPLFSWFFSSRNYKFIFFAFFQVNNNFTIWRICNFLYFDPIQWRAIRTDSSLVRRVLGYRSSIVFSLFPF